MTQPSDIAEILEAKNVLPSFKATSKKQLLQELASQAAEQTDGLDGREVFEQLLQRERLGSTAVGGGVAVPHARNPKVQKIFGLFARLTQPIEFEALDDEPVSLVFLLLAPEEAGADHLKALARVSRLMRDEEVRDGLRGADDQEAIYAILTNTRAGPSGEENSASP